MSPNWCLPAARLSRNVMREALLIALIGLSGCSQESATPLELCLLKAQDGWRPISPPGERDALLGISFADGSHTIVRDQLHTNGSEREVWFQNDQGHLSVCVYDSAARNPCETWPRTFEFQPAESGWEAAKWNPFCLQ